MIILDTNVASEVMKAQPDGRVTAWLASQPADKLYLASPVAAELRRGALLAPDGRRREALLVGYNLIIAAFADRMLPFDLPAAEAFAEIYAHRRSIGRPIEGFDGLIAAVAQARGASVATRNVSDFEGCGVALINPWAD